MSFQSFPALNQLIAHAETFIDDIDTVSLDVFDTIFIRRIEDPDLIKIPVARFIARKANALGIDVTWTDVSRERNQIEVEHRQRNGQHYPDHEARYDDYMAEMLDNVFGEKLPTGYLQTVADYEMKLERIVIVPRTELVEWIKSLHQRNKRIFFITDMYLPAHYIERLVEDKGLSAYVEAVISSADSFNAKASGTAFPLVEERYQLNRGRWLHVGDNPISDGVRPIEFGIHALVIDDAAERHRKDLARSYNLYSNTSMIWKGRNLQQVMLPLEAENADRDPLYVEGYNLFGYLLGYFMQRLAERCKEYGIKRVYFCSREGWAFQKCWQRSVNHFFPDGNAPDISYLYVSRIALSKAMIANTGLSHLEADVAFLPGGNENFLDLCRVFGLDPEPLMPHLKKWSIDTHETLSQTDINSTPESRRKLGLLLLDGKFQADVRKQATRFRDAFVRYLEDEDFFNHDQVAVVDVGWLGTVHNNFSNAISHIPDQPRIHGFVIGATRYIPYKQTRDNYLEGLLFDNHHFDFSGSLAEFIKDIIEEVCRAPHPTLLGYDWEDDKPKLIFRDNDDAVGRGEAAQSEYYAPLQEGLFDGIERYAAAAEVFGYSCGELKPWVNFMLMSKVAFPHTKEVALLKPKAHQDDFGKGSNPMEGLWGRSDFALRFSPFVRTRNILNYAMARLKN